MGKVVKWRTTADGLLEGIDENGNVVERESKKGYSPTEKRSPRGRGRPSQQDPFHWAVGPDGKKYWVPKGFNMDHVPHTVWPYSQVVADQICMKVLEGMSLDTIGKLPGFPSLNVIMRWRRDYPEFKSAIDKSYEDRAFILRDKILELVETTDKSTAIADRLRFDAYKHIMAVDNRDRFGNHTKITGDKDAPLQILVNTGIPVKKEVIDVDSQEVPQIEEADE